VKALSPLLALCMVTIASHSGKLPAAQVVRPVVPLAAAVVAAAPVVEAPAPEVNYRRIQSPSGTVFLIPDHCFSSASTYDVLVHFHGAPNVMERSLNEARLNAVVAIVNHGIDATVYGNNYYYPLAFNHLMSAVDQRVKQECPGVNASLGRVALSAWSAGYAAVQRLIRRDENAARIDAVLLSDGMHAAFLDQRARSIGPLGMEPFVDFASMAMKGEKLFSVTHSSIGTPNYASTTETASYLLNAVELSAKPETGDVGPMHRISRAERGNLRVDAFEGTQARDHGDQLRAMGKTLFSALVKRWSR
jgi:hypothetical protein